MERKKFLLIILLSFAILLTTLACGAMNRATQPRATVDPGVSQPLPPYTGLKARIAVADFRWGVGRTGSKTTITGSGEPMTVEQTGISVGLRDMLITVLVESGKFRVLERQEMAAIQSEIALTEQGYTDKSGKKRGSIKGADLLITGSVTGWDPGTEKIKAGAGMRFPGGPPGFPIPRSNTNIGFGFSKSSMAMDVRILDTATTEILTSKRVAGEVREIGLSGFVATVPLVGGLSIYSKTPMEKAIRECLNEAVKYIVSATPSDYCKY